jgi:hypothetical protein
VAGVLEKQSEDRSGEGTAQMGEANAAMSAICGHKKIPRLDFSKRGTMEVRGFEPLSAYRSLPVSTCVFRCSFLLARSSASRKPLTSQPWKSRSPGHGTEASQPEFSSPVDPTQAGLNDRREVRNQLGFYLRSQGEVIVRR